MKSLYTHSFALLSIIIGLVPLQLSADDGKPTARRAWVIITSDPDQLKKSSRIFSGNQSVELPRSKRKFSAAIAVSGNGISVSKVLPDSKPGKVWVNITIPKDIRQALVVISPKKNTDDDLEFSSQVIDLSSFTPGDWLFLNFTASTIRILEDGKATEIPTGSGAVSKGNTKDKASKTSKISYEYRKKDNDDWLSMSSSNINRSMTRREICIFSEDSNTQLIDYYGLSFNP